MSEHKDPWGWAPWLENAQQAWARTQNAARGTQSPWAGFWPPPEPQAAFGALPHVFGVLQSLMASAAQAPRDAAADGREAFAQITALFQPLLTQVMQAQQPVAAFWRQVFSEDNPNFGALKDLPGFGATLPGLDVAPLGAAREYVRQWQAYAKESAELPEKLQAFQAVMADFPERLQRHLNEAAKALEGEGKSLDSARAVFDFWVDAAELAFAEIAHSPEYGKAQGELSNLLMQLKIARQQMLDQAVEVIGLPSRRELDTTHRRVAALRRENRELKRSLSALQADVEDLKTRIRTATPKPAAKAAAKPRVAKPRAAKANSKTEESRA